MKQQMSMGTNYSDFDATMVGNPVLEPLIDSCHDGTHPHWTER